MVVTRLKALRMGTRITDPWPANTDYACDFCLRIRLMAPRMGTRIPDPWPANTESNP